MLYDTFQTIKKDGLTGFILMFPDYLDRFDSRDKHIIFTSSLIYEYRKNITHELKEIYAEGRKSLTIDYQKVYEEHLKFFKVKKGYYYPRFITDFCGIIDKIYISSPFFKDRSKLHVNLVCLAPYTKEEIETLFSGFDLYEKYGIIKEYEHFFGYFFSGDK